MAPTLDVLVLFDFPRIFLMSPKGPPSLQQIGSSEIQKGTPLFQFSSL